MLAVPNMAERKMANFSFEQSVTGLAMTILDNDPFGATSFFAVLAPPIPTGAVVSIEVFGLNISHTSNADLDITLSAGLGASINLSSDHGGSGDGYVNASFSDAA